VDEVEIDLRGIANLLRRRIRLIALTLAVVLGVAILALVAMKPVFTASSLVMVDTSRKNLLESEYAVTAPSADNARVDSEVEILRSNAVLLSTIVNENLIDDPEFGVTTGGVGLGDFFERVVVNLEVSSDARIEQKRTPLASAVTGQLQP
jgi:succinoglycan biosynthesis transport protein ExoP